MILCDDTPVPVERNQFHSLNALCKGYPHGFGLICDDIGRPTQRTPHSLISRTYGNDLAAVCLTHCQCTDIAPDAPTIQEALDAQFNECAMSNDTIQSQQVEQGEEPANSASCAQQVAESTSEDSHTCNEYWYGRPALADCDQAMRQLPDYGTTTHKLRELLRAGEAPRHPGTEGPPVPMPIIKTHGLLI